MIRFGRILLIEYMINIYNNKYIYNNNINYNIIYIYIYIYNIYIYIYIYIYKLNIIINNILNDIGFIYNISYIYI